MITVEAATIAAKRPYDISISPGWKKTPAENKVCANEGVRASFQSVPGDAGS